MQAIDTNVVVRYLADDEPEQAARAKAAVDAGSVFVSTTVLSSFDELRSEWVLRSFYGFTAGKVAAALRAFSGLPGVLVENPVLLTQALDLAEKGMDFADALHLGAAVRCEAMLTFDRQFIESVRHASVTVTEP